MPNFSGRKNCITRKLKTEAESALQHAKPPSQWLFILLHTSRAHPPFILHPQQGSIKRNGVKREKAWLHSDLSHTIQIRGPYVNGPSTSTSRNACAGNINSFKTLCIYNFLFFKEFLLFWSHNIADTKVIIFYELKEKIQKKRFLLIYNKFKSFKHDVYKI